MQSVSLDYHLGEKLSSVERAERGKAVEIATLRPRQAPLAGNLLRPSAQLFRQSAARASPIKVEREKKGKKRDANSSANFTAI